MKSILVSAVFALVFSGCTAGLFAGGLSEQDARREAQRDIASGHLKVYLAGTRGSSIVGLAAGEAALVRDLPVDRRLSRGCIDSHAQEHIAYATTYNQEIVRYLRARPKT